MRKGAQILDRFQKKNLDFVFFPFGLSNFWVIAWFPFNEGQFSLRGFHKFNSKSIKNIQYNMHEYIIRNDHFVWKTFYLSNSICHMFQITSRQFVKDEMIMDFEI